MIPSWLTKYLLDRVATHLESPKTLKRLENRLQSFANHPQATCLKTIIVQLSTISPQHCIMHNMMDSWRKFYVIIGGNKVLNTVHHFKLHLTSTQKPTTEPHGFSEPYFLDQSTTISDVPSWDTSDHLIPKYNTRIRFAHHSEKEWSFENFLFFLVNARNFPLASTFQQLLQCMNS